MKYIYDPERDVLTFVFRELEPNEELSKREVLRPGMIVNLDAEGKCISFDFFPAKIRWKSKREFKKLFENGKKENNTFSRTFTH